MISKLAIYNISIIQQIEIKYYLYIYEIYMYLKQLFVVIHCELVKSHIF
jgi:hypothetical protein